MRVASVRGSKRVPMCDKCDELDKRIEHYRRILLSIGDQITVDRIKAMIWAIVATIIGFLTTAWLGLQPWFWDLLRLVRVSV